MELYEKYFIIKETLTPACHASTIYKKKNGEILTAWFGGSREGADDVGIFLSRKSEGADFQIAEKMAGGKEPHWNPVLFSTNDQKVFLFYKKKNRRKHMENTKSSTIEGKNVGKKCRTHYRGTFNDGTQFDSSYDRGEPLEFVCGAGMMIKGFDAAVANMEVGQTLDVHLMPEEAYGLADPDAIFTVELAQLPGAEELEAGQQVYLQNAAGQPFPVKVVEKDETTITFDANHEMAGKELNFTIELVSVEE